MTAMIVVVMPMVVMPVVVMPVGGVIMIVMRVLYRVPGHNVIPEGGEPRWNPLKTL